MLCKTESPDVSYTLYKIGNLPVPMESNLLLRIQNDSNGSYTCTYKKNIKGRLVESVRSAPVIITVIDSPPSPSIFLNPLYPVYVKGEYVSITCTFSQKNSVAIQFYKNEREVYMQETPDNVRSYGILNMTRKDSGQYSCIYYINVYGRNITSQRSPYVIIDVIAIPALDGPLAAIRETWTKVQSALETVAARFKFHADKRRGANLVYQVDPPSSPILLPYPNHSIYIIGETIQMLCKTESPDVSYTLYKIGNLPVPMESKLPLRIQNNSNGSYTCTYKKNIKGRPVESVRSAPVILTAIDSPPFPSIFLNPLCPVYVKGENVSITCAFSQKNYVASQFYKNKKEVYMQETADNVRSYGILNMTREDSGQYSCMYSINVYGRNITSQRSPYVIVDVIDPPSSPILLPHPNHLVYIIGETIQMLCKTESPDVSYTLYKIGNLPVPMESNLLLRIQNNSNGSYTCTYKKNIKGRLVESVKSAPVIFTVIDPLSPPSLILGNPVQKVGNHFQVTLNCSVPDSNLNRTFHYFRINAENDNRNATGVSVSIVWQLEPIDNVVFYCEYEEDIHGRNVKSGKSKYLPVTLKEKD
ncbi:uncharacterized protein LOC134612128 [Pelobates fuscus]|uniref:uncharacterized protein LOC134612128 n=1 Tax=Pelobates fuscus TaxID=191477 RepID=UPI002FE4D35F